MVGGGATLWAPRPGCSPWTPQEDARERRAPRLAGGVAARTAASAPRPGGQPPSLLPLGSPRALHHLRAPPGTGSFLPGRAPRGRGGQVPVPPPPTPSRQGHPGPAARGLVSGVVLFPGGRAPTNVMLRRVGSSQQGSGIEAGAVRPGRAVDWGGGLPPGPAARPPGPAPHSAPRPRGPGGLSLGPVPSARRALP